MFQLLSRVFKFYLVFQSDISATLRSSGTMAGSTILLTRNGDQLVSKWFLTQLIQNLWYKYLQLSQNSIEFKLKYRFRYVGSSYGCLRKRKKIYDECSHLRQPTIYIFLNALCAFSFMTMLSVTRP